MGIEGRTKIKALLTTLAEEKIETTLTEETESGRLHVHLIELLETPTEMSKMSKERVVEIHKIYLQTNELLHVKSRNKIYKESKAIK